PAEIDAALRAATTPHRGPTFVDVPMDVFFAAAEVVLPEASARGKSAAVEPDSDAVAAVARLAAKAAKPVLVVGGDVCWAGAAAGDLERVFALFGEHATRGARPDHEPWIARLRDEEDARRAKERDWLEADTSPIHPARIYGELIPRLDRDAIVIGDGGDFVSY